MKSHCLYWDYRDRLIINAQLCTLRKDFVV